MINVSNSIPCLNCTFYKGIKTIDEKTELQTILCKKSQIGVADDLLKISGKKVVCEYQKRIE